MAGRNIILYIDDEYLNIRLFETKLGIGFHVLTAQSGLAGLEILKNFPEVKAVICDMKMPEMDGLQFTRTALEKFPHISYFLITGYEINDNVAAAIRSGLVKKCFTKPVNFREILQSLEEAISVMKQ